MSTPSPAPVPATQGQSAPVELVRIAVLAGEGPDGEGTEVDFAVPARVPLIGIVEEIKEKISETLIRKQRPPLAADRAFTLCLPGAVALDQQRTLHESGVEDGDQLWLLPIESTERHKKVTERVSTALARKADELFKTVDAESARRVMGWVTAGLVGWIELILARLWWETGSPVPTFASLVIAAVLVIAARLASKALSEQRRKSADVFGWAAVLTSSAGAGMAAPGTPGGWHIALAALTATVGVILMALFTGKYPAVLTFTLAVGAVLTVLGALAGLGFDARPERLAVAVLVVVLLAVTYASNVGGVMSGVPMPTFPSITSRGVFGRLPDKPKDTVSPLGPSNAPTGEQVTQWATRGTLAGTGVVIAAAVLLVAACRWSVVPGQPDGWLYLAFTLGICWIVILRANTFIDRTQSLTLAVAAIAAVAVVIGRYAAAPVPPTITSTLWCVAAVVALAAAVLLAALVLPSAGISAPIRRAVLGTELVLLVLVIPVVLYLMGVVSWARHLVHVS